MSGASTVERFETVVIGGGQAGLSTGYHLARLGRPFVILDASERIGDTWRNRWDSLRLFTPARFDGLDGYPFPAPRHEFPTKDQMADYLEAYARRFELPVRSGVRVHRLSRDENGFVVEAGAHRYEADHVVVAMSNYQQPWTPPLADDLAPSTVQLHSKAYRNPEQLADGPVLLVGAGNSGSEIAMELSRHHRVYMSGRDVGQIPFRPRGLLGRTLLVPLVLRVVFHRVLTNDTPIGRKARPGVIGKGGPLIRVKRRDLKRAGVERVPRVAAVRGGKPVLEDGRILDVANVIWCTGFRPGFSWIDLPVHGDDDLEPLHQSGEATTVPGLRFVGLNFLHARSSDMIHGVGRDAERAARAIEARAERLQSSRGSEPTASSNSSSVTEPSLSAS